MHSARPATRLPEDDDEGRDGALAASSLLLETTTETDGQASARFPAAPPRALSRLAANGLLLSAIHESASPEKCVDLLQQADQLAHYLRQQQRPDGSLFVLIGTETIKSGSPEIDAEYAGLALQGLIRSHKHRPQAWKLDMVRKARAFYQAQWQGAKNVAGVVSHTPAYAEAFMLSKDDGCKNAVFAMNDWLVGLQYPEEIDAARKHWSGGFPRFTNGKQEPGAPDISSALPAESLAEACRVARAVGDLPRVQRYERALIANLHFLMSLQYTSARTQHFVEGFRPLVLGAFHASHQDGNLRLDYTQHPLCAMVQYLDTVVD